MAWTAPMTAVANSVFTAAQFNTHVRDNLNETAPAKATTAGRIFVATGANAIAEREIETDVVATSQSTTSTSYVDLATAGPSVTVTTGSAAILLWTALMSNSGATNKTYVDYDVSGATSRSAQDGSALRHHGGGTANHELRAGQIMYEGGLTPGSNTFTLKYKCNGGTGTFQDRRLTVIAL